MVRFSQGMVVFKLLTMLVAFLLIALMLLGLRQRRMELTSETSALCGQVQQRKEHLLDQQVQIARVTNPKTLTQSLADSGMDPGAALHPRPHNTRPSPSGVETDLIAPLRQH